MLSTVTELLSLSVLVKSEKRATDNYEPDVRPFLVVMSTHVRRMTEVPVHSSLCKPVSKTQLRLDIFFFIP